MARIPSTVAKVVVGAGIAALALIAKFEGERPTAYLDPVGIPTICFGHTSGVKLGQTATHEECKALLQEDADKAASQVHALITDPITLSELNAYTSFVYNVGAGNFASSTLLKKLNAGDHVGACNELTRWVYAKGKLLPGLVKRRAEERELCLKELA
ncbi:putative lysozyme [Burkholderia phage Bp-AMP4]|uniref:Lysozyme n=1 Tax=Burkholderia phage Bp-AMP4 TaxID=1437329 RepID=A0A0A8KXN5_9CAUD|nr:putative lysozyme [Burkholderia phage Bp-AMP4]